ncbi:cation diffusion facilitator family transporter [Salinicoccus halodurans]|uniref:Cation transporter n=1 Tax=Salinicoccus halodurans TaxID=407035 RepID=A0A0F7HMD5_9STAP|nr:cation diffusion facilitator family transporter [Salinicoccus halodurans]AKG74267.1 cation transporter [Salinicoccus halodurans]SFK93763.1 cobalt-zinc-cadmium efflux system protein [Salinicoccus halodurans]
MEHDHHDHKHGTNKKALLISFILIASFMLIEAVGGWLANSLALLADAGHMFSDAVSLAIALAAFKFGEKVADYSKTYGYKRFEILAAVFNGVTLVLISAFIFYESIQRFMNPPEVASGGMLFIAIIGLLVNLLVAWILTRGDTKDNLNLKAAFLHVLGDMLGSVGAIIAALSIMFFGWGFMDPLASVIVAVLILISGWRVTRESLHILMEGVPKNINLDNIVESLKNIDRVEGIHGLHVWSITSGQNAMSLHVVVKGDLTVHDSQTIIEDIDAKMKEKGINQVTVQIECKHHGHEDRLI